VKNLLKLLLSIPLIFSSCEKEDDSPESNNNPIVNTTTGYFSSNSGQIYKTTDSGVNWTYQGDTYLGNGGVGISFP